MAILRRSTEKHPHPVWAQLISSYNVVEIEGFIFECKDDELLRATKGAHRNIKLHCIESIQCDASDAFNYYSFFTEQEWRNKVAAATYFDTVLKLITHVVGDSCLFKLHEVHLINDVLQFKEVLQLPTEALFIEWWRTFKKLNQNKKQVEAKPRQALTIIDNVLERNGLQWGGNIDGFILNSLQQVIAIIELRQSRRQEVELYDPAIYFGGTRTKGGDFKTWLPLVYLQKAYKIPLVLITVSTLHDRNLGLCRSKRNK